MSAVLKFERRATSSDGAQPQADIAGSVSMGTFTASAEMHIDPAVAVALGVRYGAMNAVTHTGVPATVRDALRQHAANGSEAALMTVEWLDRQLLNAICGTEAGQ
tara:strand:+ start:381 stop:695 length:315 start_codon:yes stop_codon:yes gene_type:complete